MRYLRSSIVIHFSVMITFCAFSYSQGIAQGKPVGSSTSELEKKLRIVSNQVGYLPHWPKVALLVGGQERQSGTAQLVDAEHNQQVMNITLGHARRDPQTGDLLRTLDFSTVTTPGRYFIRYQDSRSTTFRIGRDVYQEPLRVMLRSYYLQRCGVAIDDAETHIRHAACHLHDGVLAHADVSGAEGSARPTVGGWHDAGDYGKYVATATVTLGRLLTLYELYPSQFPDRQLNIPESGNGVSDLLDEVRVEIEWLRTLQREDGAIYRKVSGMSWPKNVTPDKDDQARYVFGISTPETAKFAAVTAMAARIFQPLDTEFARACLAAAQQAWRYLEQHPAMQVDWVAGDDQGSGKYLFSEVDQEKALATDVDDRLWAAVELFVTTKDDHFQQYARTQIPHFTFTLFEWKDPSALALLTYYRESTARNREQHTTKRIHEQIVNRAKRLLRALAQSGYRIANSRFVWGSNKMTAEEGITLLHAYKMTGNIAYWRAAIEQVDYLFGRNHFGISFVSNVGTHAVQHVCHIFARVAGVSIPGLLVGGPNNDAQCGIAPKRQGPRSYSDHEESYATNENAIDYNASAIALVAMLVNDMTNIELSPIQGAGHGKCGAARRITH